MLLNVLLRLFGMGLYIWGVCHSMHMEVRGQPEGVSSLSPSRGHWEPKLPGLSARAFTY